MRVLKCTALCVLAWLSLSAHAQDYWPTRSIRLVVPYAAGGGADITARFLAQLLAPALGQSVIVENKVGGGGNIGSDYVAKSAPDGYTFLLAYTGPMAINKYLYKDLPYDPLKDFEPVALVADAPLILAVHPSVPVSNLNELIAYLKANPGKLFYGSSGTGSADHLAGELLTMRTGARINHIPYKGGSQAVVDLVAGRTQLEFLTIPGGLNHIKASRLRAIALASSKRYPLFPDVPTIAQAGLQNFDITNWYGIAAPAGTPGNIVSKMSEELSQALQNKDLQIRFEEIGLVPSYLSAPDFSAYIKQDALKWEALVKASGASID